MTPVNKSTDVSGKTVLVTGGERSTLIVSAILWPSLTHTFVYLHPVGTAGLGKATVLALAARQFAKITFTGRNAQRADAVIHEVKEACVVCP